MITTGNGSIPKSVESFPRVSGKMHAPLSHACKKTKHSGFKIIKSAEIRANCSLFCLARVPLIHLRGCCMKQPHDGKKENKQMKTRNYFMGAALGTAMLAAAGCGNNSSNTPASTNAVSYAAPSTNEIIVNAPPAGMTNAPMTTNSVTSTNQ